VVAVNRCDDRNRANLVARQLGTLASESVVPCQLVEIESSREVVIEALLSVLDRIERGRSELIDVNDRFAAMVGAA